MKERPIESERDAVFGPKTDEARDLIRAVIKLSEAFPLNFSDMRVLPVRFNEECKIDGLNVAFQAGIVFGTNKSGVYGIPGNTRSILDALGINYSVITPEKD